MPGSLPPALLYQHAMPSPQHPHSRSPNGSSKRHGWPPELLWEATAAPGSELVRIHPAVGALVLEPDPLHQLVCLGGAPAAIAVGDGLDPF